MNRAGEISEEDKLQLLNEKAGITGFFGKKNNLKFNLALIF